MNGLNSGRETIYYVLAIISVVAEIILLITVFSFKSRAAECNAVVTDVSGLLVKSVYVDYEVDGQSYEHAFVANAKFGKKVGDEIVIEYDTKNAKKIKWSPQYITDLVLFGAVSAAFIALCIADLLKGKSKKKQNEYLKQNGMVLVCDVIGVATDFSVRKRGRYPYGVLECIYKDLNERKVEYFTSGRVEGQFDKSNKYVVDVYCDPLDHKKYFVDVDSIKRVEQIDQNEETGGSNEKFAR